MGYENNEIAEKQKITERPAPPSDISRPVQPLHLDVGGNSSVHVGTPIGGMVPVKCSHCEASIPPCLIFTLCHPPRSGSFKGARKPPCLTLLFQ